MSNLDGTYNLDPAHTSIGFVARHAMVTKVRGKFEDFEAKVVVDTDSPENSSATATIKTVSINTGDANRDGHVKGEDFFATEQFPEMTFNATSFDIKDESKGTVTGDLSLKGTTKPVTLDVEIFGVEEDAFGAVRIGFEASTQINRKDFGVDWQAPLNSGGVMVSEKIKIEIEGSGVKES